MPSYDGVPASSSPGEPCGARSARARSHPDSRNCRVTVSSAAVSCSRSLAPLTTRARRREPSACRLGDGKPTGRRSTTGHPDRSRCTAGRPNQGIIPVHRRHATCPMRTEALLAQNASAPSRPRAIGPTRSDHQAASERPQGIARHTDSAHRTQAVAERADVPHRAIVVCARQQTFDIATQ
jgi:hypothetical protein